MDFIYIPLRLVILYLHSLGTKLKR